MSKVESLLPQFFPTTWRQELGVFGVDFVSGVSIGFVVLEDSGYAFLLADEIETLSVGVTELLPKALANLSQFREASIKIAYPENATGLGFNRMTIFPQYACCCRRFEQSSPTSSDQDFFSPYPAATYVSSGLRMLQREIT